MSDSAIPAADGPPPEPSVLARSVLRVGVVLTALSFVALLVILGLYFAEIDPHPGLYWTTLWGFPLGFALMCTYVLTAVARRRRTWNQ